MIVWAFETLIASTLLMLLVLAIRRPVRRAFGPTIAYALWLLPVARMVLPPLPERLSEAAPVPIASVHDTLVLYVAEPLGATGHAASGPALWPYVLALWAAGALAFIGYHLIAHGRFTRRVLRLAHSIRRVAAGRVEVIETDAATGPLAFGVIRKYVAFPRDFAERFDPLERDLALAHELGHHARGDLIANWVALVVLAAHWFNPIAWRAFRAFRADQELACDALVLAGRARNLRAAYARAIVKSAHGGAVSAACHLHTINELKGRLKMLNAHQKKSRSQLLIGTAGVVVLTLTSLGVTASGTQAAERVRTNVERTIGVDLASIDVPVFPPVPALQDAPPAPPAAGAMPAPPAAPPAPIVDGEDKDGDKQVRVVLADRDRHGPGEKISKRRIILLGKDGKLTDREFADLKDLDDLPELRERLRNMPEIMSGNCPEGGGADGNFKRETVENGKRKIVICSNRIERHASAAAAAGAAAHARSFEVIRIQENAMASALEGLKNARRSITNNRDMTDTQRSAALEGIDQAIREMESKAND